MVSVGKEVIKRGKREEDRDSLIFSPTSRPAGKLRTDFACGSF